MFLDNGILFYSLAGIFQNWSWNALGDNAIDLWQFTGEKEGVSHLHEGLFINSGHQWHEQGKFDQQRIAKNHVVSVVFREL